MVGHACGSYRGTAGRLDAPGDPKQRRAVELWSVHVSEYSAGRGAIRSAREDVVGIAAVAGLRCAGAWPRGDRGGDQAEMAVLHPSGVGLVADTLCAGDADVRGCAAEDLEQHAHRNESRAAPATAAQGAHGRAFEPDQSTLFVQHAEHGVVADSV